MKFLLTKASDCDSEEFITINTLEELKDLSKKYDARLIVHFYATVDYDGHIQIYDDDIG